MALNATYIRSVKRRAAVVFWWFAYLDSLPLSEISDSKLTIHRAEDFPSDSKLTIHRAEDFEHDTKQSIYTPLSTKHDSWQTIRTADTVKS